MYPQTEGDVSETSKPAATSRAAFPGELLEALPVAVYRLDPEALATAASSFFGRFSRCRGIGFGPSTATLTTPPEFTSVKRGRPHHRFRFER